MSVVLTDWQDATRLLSHLKHMLIVHISAPFCRTVAYQHDFFHRCVSCWNNLPTTVTNATSYKYLEADLHDLI